MNWISFIREAWTGRCCTKLRCDTCIMKDRLDQQLLGIKDLKAGWFNGEGLSFSPDLINQVKFTLYAAINEGMRDKFWIYPTPDGAIRVEWSDMILYPSVEFDSLFKPLYFHHMGDKDGGETFIEVNSPIIQGIAICELLRELSGKTE